MRNLITAFEVANTIRMTRSHHKGSFLIVEGENDSKIYESFIDENNCQTIVAQSKNNAIDAMSILEASNFKGVLVIVDADFWVLELKSPHSNNILHTDTHDLETMILKTSSLEKVLRELGSKFKITKFNRLYGGNFRSVLIENGITIGYLRWISLRDKIYLNFKDLNFNNFIDMNSLRIDTTALINTVKDNSNKPGLFIAGVQTKIEMSRDSRHDLWQVCHGHDLMKILSLGLQHSIGSRREEEVLPHILERYLRLSYDRSFFRKTQLYRSIRVWEKANKPYKILRTGW